MRWSSSYEAGRLVVELQRREMLYDDVTRLTGVSYETLKNARHAYVTGDTTSMTKAETLHALRKLVTTKKNWVRYADVGRMVAKLANDGMTYDEMQAITGVPRRTLRNAKRAFVIGDTKRMAHRERFEGLGRLAKGTREPTPSTPVTETMRTIASTEVKTLRERGLTVAHIARETGLSADTIRTMGTRSMTYATYQAVRSKYASLLMDAKAGIGTPSAAHELSRKKISLAKTHRTRYLPEVRKYVREHPDALPTEVARACGVRMQMLRRIDEQYDVLPKGMKSRNDRAAMRIRRTREMLDENPSLRIADVMREFQMSRSQASVVLRAARS